MADTALVPQPLLARGAAADAEKGAAAPDQERDTRLDRLRMQLDVMVPVGSFRVGDLLALSTGGVVETVHDHGQDLPVLCGGVLLLWGEFEVVEQKLAVRITRVA